MSVSLFRAAMRRIAATVHIVTIKVAGTPMGMTATAVSSLSADPASLLVCVNRSATMHAALVQSPHFGVNALHHDQLDIARTFSDSTLRAARFTGGDWRLDEAPAPFLADAQASFVCERSQIVEFGTHSIIIGTVMVVHIREATDPLIYLDGRFTSVAPA